MPNINELKNKRGQLVAEARSILDTAEKETRELSSEENVRYSKIFTDIDALKVQIEREERLVEEERSLASASRSIERAESYKKADNAEEIRSLETYKNLGYKNLSDKEKEVINGLQLRAFRKAITNKAPAFTEAEHRSLMATSAVEGGYLLAPEMFVSMLLKNVDDAVFIRNLATKFQLADYTSMGVPTLDTDVSDADWTAEVQTAPEDANLRVGKRTLTPHKVSKLIKISNQLLRGSSINPEDLVRARMAYKFGITHEKAFLLGSGSQQPLGLFVASASGVPTSQDVVCASQTAIAFDDLKKAKYSLKQQYQGRAGWLFHRNAIEAISKLKDGNNNYLWQPSVIATEPDRLLGSPVYMSEYVPNTFTTGLYVGMYADFSQYWVVDSTAIEFVRLNELYQVNDQIGVIARIYTDGQPVLPEAFARIKLA